MRITLFILHSLVALAPALQVHCADNWPKYYEYDGVFFGEYYYSSDEIRVSRFFRDANGNNFLHLASQSGEVEKVRELLKYGVCHPLIFEMNDANKRPSQLASNMEIKELLLVKEVEKYTPNAVNNKKIYKECLEDICSKNVKGNLNFEITSSTIPVMNYIREAANRKILILLNFDQFEKDRIEQARMRSPDFTIRTQVNLSQRIKVITSDACANPHARYQALKASAGSSDFYALSAPEVLHIRQTGIELCSNGNFCCAKYKQEDEYGRAALAAYYCLGNELSSFLIVHLTDDLKYIWRFHEDLINIGLMNQEVKHFCYHD